MEYLEEGSKHKEILSTFINQVSTNDHYVETSHKIIVKLNCKYIIKKQDEKKKKNVLYHSCLEILRRRRLTMRSALKYDLHQ